MAASANLRTPPRRLLLGLLDPHANDLAVEPSPVFGVVEQAVSLRERICACLGSAGQHWPALDGGPSSSAAAADIDLATRFGKHNKYSFRRAPEPGFTASSANPTRFRMALVMSMLRTWADFAIISIDVNEA